MSLLPPALRQILFSVLNQDIIRPILRRIDLQRLAIRRKEAGRRPISSDLYSVAFLFSLIFYAALRADKTVQ